MRLLSFLPFLFCSVGFHSPCSCCHILLHNHTLLLKCFRDSEEEMTLKKDEWKNFSVDQGFDNYFVDLLFLNKKKSQIIKKKLKIFLLFIPKL